MTTKTLAFVAKVFVVCFLTLACSGNKEQVKQNTDDSLSIRLAVLPVVDCLPYYYATNEGIYDSLGLHVELDTYAAAMDADTAFCKGHTDGIVTDMVKACIWKAAGDSVKVVMSGELKLYLMTAFSARIRQTSSLKEKIIGITRNSAVDMFTDELLWQTRFVSTDLNKPQINNLTLRCLMVDQNQYDGAVMPEPFASECEARGARRIKSTDELNLTLSAVVMRDSVLKAHKENIHLLKEGYDIAVERINKLISDYQAELNDTTRLFGEPEAPTLMSYLPQDMRVEIPDSLVQYRKMSKATMPDDSTMARVVRWCKGRGLLKKEFTASDLLYKKETTAKDNINK